MCCVVVCVLCRDLCVSLFRPVLLLGAVYSCCACVFCLWLQCCFILLVVFLDVLDVFHWYLVLVVDAVCVSSDSCLRRSFRVLFSCNCCPLLMCRSLVLPSSNVGFHMFVNTHARSFIHYPIRSPINPYIVLFIRLRSYRVVASNFIWVDLIHSLIRKLRV